MKEKHSVVPSPVVVFTKADADRVAEMAPIKPKADSHNIIAVGAMTDLGMIQKNMAQMIVTHHAKRQRSGAEEVVGSWAVGVRIAPLGTGEPHCFKVIWPDDKEKPKPERNGKIFQLPPREPVAARV